MLGGGGGGGGEGCCCMLSFDPSLVRGLLTRKCEEKKAFRKYWLKSLVVYHFVGWSLIISIQDKKEKKKKKKKYIQFYLQYFPLHPHFCLQLFNAGWSNV